MSDENLDQSLLPQRNIPAVQRSVVIDALTTLVGAATWQPVQADTNRNTRG